MSCFYRCAERNTEINKESEEPWYKRLDVIGTFVKCLTKCTYVFTVSLFRQCFYSLVFDHLYASLWLLVGAVLVLQIQVWLLQMSVIIVITLHLYIIVSIILTLARSSVLLPVLYKFFSAINLLLWFNYTSSCIASCIMSLLYCLCEQAFHSIKFTWLWPLLWRVHAV